MADLPSQLYSMSDDGVQRLTKDLNYMFQHLDENNVRRLYTEYCKISSEAGETELLGALLVMSAKGDTTVRLKAGWDEASSEFVFNLYAEDGSLSLGLNSTGNAVLKGDINTIKDIYVGNRIFLGWSGSTTLPLATLSTRGMYIMKPNTTQYMAAVYSTNVQSIIGTTYPVYEFEIESSDPMNITSKEKMRIYMYAGYDGVTTNSVNSTDYMTLFAFNQRLFVGADHAEHSTAKRGLYLGGDNKAVYLGSYEQYYNQVTGVLDQAQDYRRNEFRYYFAHNQKYITSPNTAWTVSVSTNTNLTATTWCLTSTNNAAIQITDTTINIYAEVYSSFAAVDISQSYDGTAFTSDDYMVFAFYINSVNINPSHGVYFQIGFDSSNYYRYYLTSTNGDTWYAGGWNYCYRKIGDYESVLGAPTLNNISWARMGYRSNGDASVVLIIDYIGVVRGDTSVGANPVFNVFQKTLNSTRSVIRQPISPIVMRSHAGVPALCQLPCYTYTEYDLFLRNYVQDFECEVENTAMVGGEAPAIAVYYSTANTIKAVLSSHVLRLNGLNNGSTWGTYINVNTFAQYKATTIRLAKQENYVKASFMVTTDPQTFREVAYSVAPSTRCEYGSLYIGNSDYDVGTRLTNILLRKYNEY